MKKMLSSLLCLISISSMVSCDTNNHDNKILVTDMSGVEVWVPKQPKKVAAVSPSTGDLMIAFGLGDILESWTTRGLKLYIQIQKIYLVMIMTIV